MSEQMKPLKVNGQEIPEEAVNYELKRLVQFYSQHMAPEKVKEQMEVLRKRARQQAVGTKLLMDEARRLDVPVPVDRIDAKYDQIVESSGGSEAFGAMLAQQDLTEELVRRSIEQGLKVDILVEQTTAEVTEPTEEEIQQHFEAHEDEYVKPERAQARHILIKPASESDADRETARSKLLELRHQIEEGADFADLAAVHSECPSGRKSGGSLGWFGRGMMVKAFDDAVFSMEVGTLSDMVATEFGFHLIQKVGHEAAGPAELGEVSDKVRDFLRHAKRGEAISAYVSELAEKAEIEGF